MTSRTPEKTLRPTRWTTIVVILIALGFIVGSVVCFLQLGAGLISLGMGACALFAVAAIIEALTLRVVLSDEALHVAKFWWERKYPRSQIQSVTWEKDGGVSLKLTTGSWVNLPGVGGTTQGAANSIRAWLKRPASRCEEQRAGGQTAGVPQLPVSEAPPRE